MPLTILMYGTVPHIMVGLERLLDYRGVGLERFHCIVNSLCQVVGVHSLECGEVLPDIGI